MFKNKVAVVTGGARGIGKCIRQQLEQAGATVCVIDILDHPGYVGDIADPAVLEDFARQVIERHGHVDILINNAKPAMVGIDEGSYEAFLNALQVGVAAPSIFPSSLHRILPPVPASSTSPPAGIG